MQSLNYHIQTSYLFIDSFYECIPLQDCYADPQRDGEWMTCVMPNIRPLMTTLSQKLLVHVKMYFVMDGITELRNLDKYDLSLSNFIYNPNPYLMKFEEENFVKEFDLTESYLDIKV